MRVLLTGQIGLDKKQYLEEVAAIARARGDAMDGGGTRGAGEGGGLKLYHIGDMMYREAPDVPPGRILDLPLSRLNSLRRAVFRDVLADMHRHKNVILNTHATFRWKHGLFAAFDFDQLALFNADLYVVLVDNIETVHARLLRDQQVPGGGGMGGGVDHSLKDLMVWREEEILATEILAKAPTPQAPPPVSAAVSSKFLVLARGRDPYSTAETLYRLIYRPHMKKVYPSFPMSHVADLPGTLAEINAFRAAIAEKFIAFDPGDVDEKLLAEAAIKAARQGSQTLTIPHPAPPPRDAELATKKTPSPRESKAKGRKSKEDAAQSLQNAGNATLSLKVADLLAILPDIDGQIYARDFILVRQSDLIISYIPELPGPGGKGKGKPGLSSGVERELQHAHDHARETYVIWKPAKPPSPFITQTATRVFRTTQEAFEFFEQKGYFQPHSLFGG